jgi:hypothetical protein
VRVTDPLASLTGLELSGVCMVRDYVEFHFDGPVLRALTDPTGNIGDRTWRFPEQDSLWLLRQYIGRQVTEVEERPEQSLTLSFDSDHIVIPLDQDARVGVEAAHLVPVDERGRLDIAQMWVW